MIVEMMVRIGCPSWRGKLLLGFCLLWCSLSYAQAQNVVDDQLELQALQKLFDSTGGMGWTNTQAGDRVWSGSNGTSSGGTSTPGVPGPAVGNTDFSTWYGVTVTNGDVTQIDLSENQLAGSLPEELGNLTALQELYLGRNQLKGEVPATVGSWTALTDLDLSHNQFTGDLPTSIRSWTNLVTLKVNDNGLTGLLTSWLYNWKDLSWLEAGHNQFEDVLLSGTEMPTKLSYFDCSYNSIYGFLPGNWGALTVLTTLDVSHNKLMGGLPAGWSDGQALQVLRLSANQFISSIPVDPIQAPLTELDLSNNQLDGPLPVVLLQVPTLLLLNVANNRLVGSLPNARLATNLVEWHAEGNRFTGALPFGLGQLTALEVLNFSRNQLSGTLPDSLTYASALHELGLTGNRLSGHVPLGWTTLPDLYRIDLSGNQLTGTIPAFAGTATGGQFIFANNQFTDLATYQGPNLSQTTLDVHGNQLDFADLEANVNAPAGTQVQHGFEAFFYIPQFPPAADTTLFVHLAMLHLSRHMNGQHISSYQWERQLGGQWYALAGETTTQLSLNQAAEADQGYYRLAVVDKWVPGLVLYTRNVYADLVPYAPLPENRPGDRDIAPLTDIAPPVSRSGATDSVNYVRTHTLFYDANGVIVPAEEQVTTTYLDGLGRVAQTVNHHQSTSGLDLVQPVVYDAFGREVRQYSPYASAGTGQYRPDAVYEQYHFYRDTTPRAAAAAQVAPTAVAYSETLFEPSPLNRTAAQAAPGESWGMATGQVKILLERPNTLLDSVQAFLPNISGGLGPQGFYAAGELWGTQVMDEHQYRTIEWKDKRGYVVLQQVEFNRVKIIKQEARVRWLRTYYLYDDFGHLRAVLPPEAVKVLQSNSWQVTTAVERLLFRYSYDARGRVVSKQVPGTEGETQVVYDQLDRPILTQDAAQRERGEWSFTKYDALSRPIYTGLGWSSTLTQATLQTGADAATGQYEERIDMVGYPGHYTTQQAYPPLRDGVARPSDPNPANGIFSSYEVLTLSHYDDYNFDNDAQDTPDATFDATAASALSPVPAADARATGQVTRTRTRVLGVPSTAPGAWLQTTTFYDDRARPVQVQSNNARGGQDVATSQLDFAGKVQKSVVIHHGPNLPAAGVQVIETNTYDPAGRLTAVSQQVDDEPQAVPVASLHYNELGQLTRKILSAGALLQNVDYTYNPRGWLTKLNDAALSNTSDNDLFGLELCYEQGFTADYAQYNGNITGQKWRSRKDGVERAYGYVYDRINRLRQGDYVARATAYVPTSPWTAEAGNHRLFYVSYDDNGNILTLRRRGLLAEATRTTPKQYGPVDYLSYAYDGNRLRAVTDWVTTNELPRLSGYNGAPTSLAGDFQEQGVRDSQEYFYDANGNLTEDRNKGITGILYNHLNLPRQIHFGTGADSVVFRYAASGQKVAKLVYQTGKPMQRTDYLGAFQYEQDTLRFFPHAEGRVLRFASSLSGQVRYEREFTIKDHLGNLRLAYRLGHNTTVTATLEPGNRDQETQQFDSVSVSDPVAVNVAGQARTGQYVALLNAVGHQPTPGRYIGPTPIGPLKQLAVQKGDTVRVVAPGYYPQPVQQTNFAFSLASFVAGLLQQPSPSPGPGDGNGRPRVLPLLSIGVSAGLPALVSAGGGVPKGYVRLLVFDADSNLVSSQTQQLSSAAAGGYEDLVQQVTVQQDGYVTVYVGNESDVDVYFDDVTVEHRPGLQVQETEYDPVGMQLAGLGTSSPGLRQLNQYQWNGKEFQQDLGLNWTNLDWRMFDPQLGRFHVVDPLSDAGQEMWSTYQFGFDNAVRFNDPDGRCPCEGIIDNLVSFADGFGNAAMSNNTTLPGGGSLVERREGNSMMTLGQTVADAVSVVQGAAEVVLGDAMIGLGGAGGVITSPTGVGAFAGAAVVAGGFALAGHGVATAFNGANNLFDKGNGRVNSNRVSNQSSPSVTEQATKLKDGPNGGKNSVTIKTGNGQTRYDLAGKTHGNVPTPHSQSYKNNVVGGVVKSVTRTSKTAKAMDNSDLRAVRKYFERKQ